MINEAQMQHGRHWGGRNVKGWIATEKFRGCRAYWDGHQMWSRGGNLVQIPQDMRDELPIGRSLDGEIWAGRGPANGEHEQEAVAAVARGAFTDRIQFIVFDAPDVMGPWVDRIRAAASIVDGATRVAVIGFDVVKSMRHLEQLYAAVMKKAGEGLMLYDPTASEYSPGRSRAVLKVKIDPAMARGVVRFAAAA